MQNSEQLISFIGRKFDILYDYWLMLRNLDSCFAEYRTRLSSLTDIFLRIYADNTCTVISKFYMELNRKILQTIAINIDNV